MKPLKFTSMLLMGVLAFGCKKDASQAPAKVNPSGGPKLTTNTVGTTYYVSPTGSDTNNGTSTSTPWKTITKVNSHTYAAGDQVFFQGGQTFAGNIVASSSGTSGSYIHYGSYGTGRASINGGTGTGVYIYDKSYVWVDNLIIYGGWNETSQSGNTGTGVMYYNDVAGSTKLGYCYVSGCDVSGFQNAGIEALSGSTAANQNGYTQVVISSNTVHDNGVYGIVTLGPQGSAGSTAYAFSYVYVGSNKVYNNYGLKAQTSNHTGDGILVGDAGSGTVEHNVAYNNGWYNNSTGGGPAAIWCYDSTALTFQYNEAYNNGTGTGRADGDGFDLDGGATNCIMQYNYSHNNYAAGYLVWEYGDTRGNNGGNIIRYNISQGDAYNGTFYGSITSSANCNNNEYYNNTIYTTFNPAVMDYGGTGNGFYNNILYDNSTHGTVYCATGLSGAYFLDNDYYAGSNTISINYNGTIYTTVAAFRTATFNEVYSGTNYGYSSNPSLSSAGGGGTIGTGTPGTLTSYKLNAGSPMINTGFNLTTWSFNVGTIDFNGATIPNGTAYDIGACEYH